MPYLETPAELAEWVADQVGVYGGGCGEQVPCNCRCCFVAELTQRIRDARDNEIFLKKRVDGVT